MLSLQNSIKNINELDKLKNHLYYNEIKHGIMTGNDISNISALLTVVLLNKEIIMNNIHNCHESLPKMDYLDWYKTKMKVSYDKSNTFINSMIINFFKDTKQNYQNYDYIILGLIAKYLDESEVVYYSHIVRLLDSINFIEDVKLQNIFFEMINIYYKTIIIDHIINEKYYKVLSKILINNSVSIILKKEFFILWKRFLKSHEMPFMLKMFIKLHIIDHNYDICIHYNHINENIDIILT